MQQDRVDAHAVARQSCCCAAIELDDTRPLPRPRGGRVGSCARSATTQLRIIRVTRCGGYLISSLYGQIVTIGAISELSDHYKIGLSAWRLSAQNPPCKRPQCRACSCSPSNGGGRYDPLESGFRQQQS